MYTWFTLWITRTLERCHLSSKDMEDLTLDSAVLGDTSQSFSIDSDILTTTFQESLEPHDVPGSLAEERDFPTLNIENSFHQPLYEGAGLTIFESYLSLMQFSLRHGLTKHASSNLLTLVGEHLPSNSMVSLYKLRKFFEDAYDDMSFTTHYCCACCHAYLSDVESICPNGCEVSGAMEFLTVPVEPQLKRRLEGK